MDDTNQADSTQSGYATHEVSGYEAAREVFRQKTLRQALYDDGDVVMADERVLKAPEPMIKVGSFGDSSVDILVRPWVKTEDYFRLKSIHFVLVAFVPPLI